MDTLINLPHPSRRRDRVFSIRVSSDEYQSVQLLAHRLRISPSGLARYILLQSVHHLTMRSNEGRER